VIQIQTISKQYGSKVLFENASAHWSSQSKVALVGPNGAGKSTLIRMLLGQETPDQGGIRRPKQATVGHLAQELPTFQARSVLEEVLRQEGRREALLLAKHEVEAQLENDPAAASDEDLLHRYGRILEEWEAFDESRFEARAKSILSGMGFQEKDWGRALSEFSGGWLMRVALARLLLQSPDLLILDEPTNHLDLESVLWLEGFLSRFRGAVLLVSHDRAFLNRIVTEVLEIDQKRLWSYRGNLDAYALQKAERLAVLQAQQAAQQAKINQMEAFIDRFGAKATKARQAQSRLKQLEKLEAERVELPEQRQTIRFRFPPAPPSGKEVITARGCGIAYGQQVIFQNWDWILPRKARVALVGRNGAGKTTLLKLLSRQLTPSSGDLFLGHQVELGYYAQHQAESLHADWTVLKELEAAAPHLPVSQIRGIAGAFLFSGDSVEKRCGVLSGGEKARVALAKLLLSPSNLLVLDEPTNHLDADSRAVLLEALKHYEGTLILVSHDRDFVAPLVDTVLEIHPETQTVIPLLGSYGDYLERKQRELQSAVAVGASPSGMASAPAPGSQSVGGGGGLSQGSEPRAPSNNQRKAWERRCNELEGLIEELEGRQKELHALLADPLFYEKKSQVASVLEEQRQLDHSLETHLGEWESLLGLLNP
jgi:ATP-binding cassette subfamily F protein 3